MGRAPHRRILLASLIGTTIEFYDFYIYAAAAVLIFPRLFFPAADAVTGTLQSLATFALAFFARPLGSALFGHFGDRIGRKATLVGSLLTMGLSTVAIGLLPTYASAGLWAPALLALCRIGQGIGLGGEWGGAVLLATENAPSGRECWYGGFPQLGAPIGFLCSTGVFLFLSSSLAEASLFSWGWRLPFLASAALVFIGLYIRLRLVETPAFVCALKANQKVRMPIASLFREHWSALVRGTLATLAAFVIFYLMTVFSLSWATKSLGFDRSQFLLLQLIGVFFFGLTIPLSARASDRWGPRAVLLFSLSLIIMFGFCFAPLLTHNIPAALVFMVLGFSLVGLTYAPVGAALASLFPTAVRYTGTSLAFNLAGIIGASITPYAATWLAARYDLTAVGYYLSLSAVISLLAVAATRSLRAVYQE